MVHGLERRRHDGRELHDDGAGDVWTDTEHDDGELRQTTAGEDIQQAEKFVACEKRSELDRVNARDRDSGQCAEDDECKQGEKNPLSQDFILKDESDFCKKCIHVVLLFYCSSSFFYHSLCRL